MSRYPAICTECSALLLLPHDENGDPTDRYHDHPNGNGYLVRWLRDDEQLRLFGHAVTFTLKSKTAADA